MQRSKPPIASDEFSRLRDAALDRRLTSPPPVIVEVAAEVRGR